MLIRRSNLGSVLTLVLATSWSVFGADNLLTPQEKAQGWILLFDGKSLNGWDSARTPAPGYEITANGDHLVVVLNGTKTLDIHDSKYSDGRIRLQYQKFPIEFKNIKLKLVNHEGARLWKRIRRRGFRS